MIFFTRIGNSKPKIIRSIDYVGFPRLVLVAYFCHAWQKLYVFPRYSTSCMFSSATAQVVCFRALLHKLYVCSRYSTSCMFSRATAQVVCFHALQHKLYVFARYSTSCMFSRATAQVVCFPAI